MIRTLLTLAAGIGVGVAVTFAADHDHHKAVKVTQLSQRDIIEKLDGKAASATVVEVTFEPGQNNSPHHHTGPVFGYVLEGEYEHALDDAVAAFNPTERIKGKTIISVRPERTRRQRPPLRRNGD